MFESNTLFILGAGASKPYGFPLGNGLVKAIIEDMQDQIYIPLYDRGNNPRPVWNATDDKEDFLYEFEKFEKEISCLLASCDEITQEHFFDHNGDIIKLIFNNLGFPIEKLFRPIKISRIDIFRKLKNTLIEFDPVSIDAFLRDNPSHQKAGKIMIIYSLLKREEPAKMALNSSDKRDNWYSLLFNDLVSGCADNPEGLLKNKVKFTTFNYDLSLDHYLKSRIIGTEVFREKYSTDLSIAETFLKENPIKHIYGTCYQRDAYTYGRYNTSPVEAKRISGKIYPPQLTSKGLQNFKRFTISLTNYQNIKTMYQERKQDINENKSDLAWAENIIIIGFGFDRDNLTLLGFPDNEEDFENILTGKTIRYLNFEGSNKSLSKEFDELSEYSRNKNFHIKTNKKPIPRFKLIESTAESISAAYLNDFKKYLFK